MRAVVTNSRGATNPVKPAKLGAKMKASVKVNKTSSLPPIPTKSSHLMEDKTTKIVPHVINTTLPPKWISTCAPSNFKFAKDLKLSSSFSDIAGPKSSTPVSKVKTYRDRSVVARISEHPKRDNPSSKVSRQVDKPRLHTNSSVYLSQKLKQKEMEIDTLKKKIWQGNSRDITPRRKSTVVDVLGNYGIKGREGAKLRQGFERVNCDEKKKMMFEMMALRNQDAKKDEELLVLRQQQLKIKEQFEMRQSELDATKEELKKRKAIDIVNSDNRKKINLEIMKLRNSNADKDAELLELQQRNLKMNDKLEKSENELAVIKEELRSKDLEMLGALTDKNEEIFLLKKEKCQLEEEVLKHSLMSADAKKISQNVVITSESDNHSMNIEEETREFLDRISHVCRDGTKVKAESADDKVKIQVKVTVKKVKSNRMSHQSSFSDTFDSPSMFLKTPLHTDIKEECDEEEEDRDKVQDTSFKLKVPFEDFQISS